MKKKITIAAVSPKLNLFLVVILLVKNIHQAWICQSVREGISGDFHKLTIKHDATLLTNLQPKGNI